MFQVGSLTHILLCIPIPFIYYLGSKVKKDIIYPLSITLFIMEIFKQFLYIYYHIWSVWILPFQLCSIPMYAFLFKGQKKYFYSYIQSYALIGAVFALLYPKGMIHQQLLLTIHGFLWHYILLLMAANAHKQSYRDGLILFMICVCIATIINVAFSSAGEINMFYINPLQISNQPVFHTIGMKYGILVQNTVYIITIATGAKIVSILTDLRTNPH